jgi:TonB-dependent receptor
LNYQARPDILLRAAWTNTIGRPNYDASVPTFEEDNGAGTAGNPNLKPYTSMGLDLSAEYYPGADSIFSVGVFYKRLKNPIFTETIQDTSFAGVALTSLSQPQNADSGELFGIEANAQTRFTFLPAPFDGFGISANGTYVTSSVKVPGRETEDIPFFGQSDWIVNAALFYERGPFEARVAVSHRSAAIVNVGNRTQGALSDIYDDGRTVVDARLSYKLSEAVEVFGSLSNITEAPLTFYQTNKSRTFSRQIYSYNADVGVSMRF